MSLRSESENDVLAKSHNRTQEVHALVTKATHYTWAARVALNLATPAATFSAIVLGADEPPA